MKLKTTLLAATLATFAVSTAYAKEEQHSDAKADAPKVEKTEAKKPVKKHNHMEEKTGMPMNEPKAKSERSESPASQMPVKKHSHPTDR